MRIQNPDDYTLEGFEVSGGKSKYNAVLKHKTTGRLKRVSFGAKKSNGKPYEQYHDKLGVYSKYDHGDEARRQRYLQRHREEDAYKFSSGWFSIHYLW